MAKDHGEKSGGNVNYYLCEVKEPKRKEIQPYTAECEDIIQALGMTFSEGCAFKAIWRSCAERELGLAKLGGDAIYDAEKTVHYGNLMIKERRMRARTTELKRPPLGLTPKFICDETRIAEIEAAVARYAAAGKGVPSEWLQELEALTRSRLSMTSVAISGVTSITSDNDISTTYAGNLGTVTSARSNIQGGNGGAMVSGSQDNGVCGGGVSFVSGNGGIGGGGPGTRGGNGSST